MLQLIVAFIDLRPSNSVLWCIPFSMNCSVVTIRLKIEFKLVNVNGRLLLYIIAGKNNRYPYSKSKMTQFSVSSKFLVFSM